MEAAILDHESEEIHLQHLAAAAYELPLSADDADVLGPRWQAYAERLVRLGVLRDRGGTFTPEDRRVPGGPDRAAQRLDRLVRGGRRARAAR